MKKQNMQDERITAQRRIINSEAYVILMIVLYVSILVQQFLLNAPFDQYAVEFVCIFGISLYTIVRYMMQGLNIFGEGKWAKSIPLVNSIITGIIITAINGILNYIRYAEHYKEDGIGFFIAAMAVTFISATTIVYVLISSLNFLNMKKQAKIQKQLDEDEQDE